MNKEQPSSNSILRTLRDTVIDASPQELEEALQGAGLDKDSIAKAGKDAVKSALKEFESEQNDDQHGSR